MRYFIEWLKSFGLVIEIEWINFHIQLLLLNTFIVVFNEKLYFNFSITLPKYALIFTNQDKFFYKNSEYYFYRKSIISDYKFYVLHVVGMDATAIEGKESKWS
jgi:hypothetical protein